MTTRMDMLVTARNQASGVFRDIEGSLNSLNNSASIISGGLMGIAAGIGIDSVVQLGKAVFDLGRDAQGVEALRSSFDSMAQSIGSSGDAMLSSLRGMSQGMVADQDLILSANRAIVLGVANNSQQMEQLMQVAISRGRAMGLSATQAFNDLVTGLGRMSPLILDNLGIVTGGEKVFKDYAAGIGKTAEQLSDAEKKQALFNKVLTESKDIMAQGVQANPFAQMDASITNLREKLGALVAPLAGDIAAAISKGLSDVSVSLDEGKSHGMKTMAEQLGYVVGASMADGIKKGVEDGGKGLNDVLLKLTTNYAAIQSGNQVGLEMRKGILEALDQNTSGQAQMQQLIELQSQLAEVRSEIQLVSQEYAKLIAAGNVDLAAQPAESLKSLGATAVELYGKIQKLQADMGGLIGPTQGVAKAAWDGVAAWQNFGGATSGAAAAQSAAVPVIADMTEQLKAEAAAAAAASAQLQGMYLSAASALGATQALSMWQNKQGELAGLRDMWKRQGMSGDQIKFNEAAWMQQQQKGLQWQLDAPKRAAEAQAALNEKYAAGADQLRNTGRQAADFGERFGGVSTKAQGLADATGKAFGDMGDALDKALKADGGGGISDVEKAFNDLQGRVQGILSGALNVDVGVSPDSILPREDAVNEDARRLADVMVKGFESPWYEYLNQKFPSMFEGAGGDVKTRAAQIMRDFQAGLEPELIDKDKVKEQVKRMILGEQSMASLADEIAQELSQEMGVSFAKAKESVGAVMGMQQGDGSGAGATIADGFAQATQGEDMVGGLVERMEAAYQRLQQSGVTAGKAWGAGFMSVVETGVSAPLVQLLVTLITPGVVKALQANGSKSGAQ